MTSGGYVGLSIATLLSQHHKVMAVDIVPEKVELINSKKSPIQDEYIEKYLTEKELNDSVEVSKIVKSANKFFRTLPIWADSFFIGILLSIIGAAVGSIVWPKSDAEQKEQNQLKTEVESVDGIHKYGIAYLGFAVAFTLFMLCMYVFPYVEKPTQEVAKDYIAKGALWNGGVFAFKLGYVLNRAHELIDFVDYDDLFNKYDTLNKISFDYAVVEHEPEIEVMHFAGTWKDLGTWNTLTEAMDGHVVGEAMLNEKCENVHVVNELDVPILCMGLKDVVVSASPEGILVSDKEQSSYIKPFVNMLDHRVMFAEKSWGSFKVIDIDKESMTIKVTLNAGHRMNYHSHQHRDEVWTVIAGEGKTVVDGMEQNVKAGDVITMSAAV